MQRDDSTDWTCKKCGVTFTRHDFVRHVKADACKLPRHRGQLIQSLGVFDRLLYHPNGRARAFRQGA